MPRTIRRPTSDASHHGAGSGRVALGIGVALYVVFGCLFAFGTPPMTGPDEGAHAVFIRVLATQRQLPDFGPPAPYSPTATTTHQAQHPPGYYLLCAPVYRLLQSSGVDPWLGLRLLSVLIGAATVFVVWRIGRMLFPSDSLAAALAATVGMVPMFQYMTAMINNIGLAILFVALAGHRLAIILNGHDERREWFILGILFGLAGLTNLMGLALCVIPVLVLLVTIRSRATHETLLRLGAIIGGPALLVGWWFARNWDMHGSLTPMFEGDAFTSAPPLELLMGQPMMALKSAGIVLNNGLLQLWSCTWLMRETGAPTGVIPLLYVVAYAGFALFLLGVARGILTATGLRRSWAFIGLVAFLIIYLGVMRQVWYVDAQVAGFVGRYLVILLPFALPLAARSLEALKPAGLKPTVALTVLWAFLVVVNAAHTAYVLWFFQRH